MILVELSPLLTRFKRLGVGVAASVLLSLEQPRTHILRRTCACSGAGTSIVKMFQEKPRLMVAADAVLSFTTAEP